MTQEFHISVTPIGDDEYLVRTERVAPGVPLAEEQVIWPVDEWLERASVLMNDPIAGLLRGDGIVPFTEASNLFNASNPAQAQHFTNLVVLGQHLYNALFQGTIRDSWMTAQGIAQHRQEILRLRLGLKDMRLPRLPWEVLRAGDRPLATGTDVLFSRYNSSFAAMSSFQYQQVPAIEPGQTLKILLVLSAPSDQEVLALKQEALHLQEELRELQNGNRNGRFPDIQLTLLEQPGREQLTQALEHNHYQVLHYAGHSNLGTEGGKLYLVSSKTGLTESLSGDDLAGLLVNNGIRMAVFNSCRGAYTATEATGDSEGNLAEALVKRGIPAVLAMAERIPDDVALNLSRLFYRNLKQLYPIDLSLSRARQGLLSSYGSNQMYWALPILYLHPEFDGYLQPPTEGAGELPLTLDEVLRDEYHTQDWELEVVAEPEELMPPQIAPDKSAGLSEENLNAPELDHAPALLKAEGEEFEGFESELLDPEDLEFDDPEYQPELATVAKLVQQLSQASSGKVDEDVPLPASPTESLLPQDEPAAQPKDYLDLADNPRYDPPMVTPNPKRKAVMAETEAPTILESDDGSVYLELERLLAETGKPTEAIAICNRAIQADPSNPEPYDRLGLTLYGQGYLSEAIAAYQQAIRINPSLADAHNHLGLALYQQGNVRDSIRAYSRAIQLDPTLKEARKNLDIALRKQGVHLSPSQLALETEPPKLVSVALNPAPNHSGNGTALAATVPAKQISAKQTSIQTLPPPPSSYERARAASLGRAKRSLLWAGAGAISIASVVLGVWFFQNHPFDLSGIRAPQPQPEVVKPIQNLDELKTANTATITAFATEQLNQGNVQDAEPAIETLLERGEASQAVTAMTPTLNRKTDNATVNFLMGRAAWQLVKEGNRDYSVADARRYWEATVHQEATPKRQNALGFAWYAEGNLDQAYRTWLLTLPPAEGNSPTRNVADRATPRYDYATLTAYAGLSLVLVKQAENKPPAERAQFLAKAKQLRRIVLEKDPTRFQPDALAKNWMWSGQAIADWKTLLSIK